MPLEFGHAFEKLRRRRRRRLHVLVDRGQSLRFERGGRAILLIGRGVLQHVQRRDGARERDVGRAGVGEQLHPLRQRYPNLDERPRPQQREVLRAVVRVDRTEQRIGRVGVDAPRPLEPLPSGFDGGRCEAESVLRTVAGGARTAVASWERPKEVHGAPDQLLLGPACARLPGGGQRQVFGFESLHDRGELGLVFFDRLL